MNRLVMLIRNIYSDITIVPHTPMYMSTHLHIHAHITQSPSNKKYKPKFNKPTKNYRTISKPEENYHETKNHSL